jgi:HlyD family secretion protein
VEARQFHVSTKPAENHLAQGERGRRGSRLADTLAVLDARELEYGMEQLQAGLRELNAQEAIYRTQIATAEEDLAYVEARQGRNEKLFEASVIPRQNLEDGQNLEAKARNLLKSTRQSLSVLDAKRASLAAQQKVLQKKLADCVVTSQASGTVETLFYSEGEVLPPLGQLAELSDLDDPEISIYVSEEWLARLKVGALFKLRAQGYRYPLDAELIRISNRAEFTPKTALTPDNRNVMVYALRLRVNNREGILKDGMPVDVSLK